MDEVFSSSAQKRFLATPLGERAQTPPERTMAASMLLHEMAMVPLNAGEDVEVFSLSCSAECDAECVDIELEKLVGLEESLSHERQMSLRHGCMAMVVGTGSGCQLTFLTIAVSGGDGGARVQHGGR